MDEIILFYWSKGAGMRTKILIEVFKCSKKKQPCFLNKLAEAFNVSHVAMKKHVDLLVEENYLKEMNPDGKPVYLELSEKGKNFLEKFRQRKI